MDVEPATDELTAIPIGTDLEPKKKASASELFKRDVVVTSEMIGISPEEKKRLREMTSKSISEIVYEELDLDTSDERIKANQWDKLHLKREKEEYSLEHHAYVQKLKNERLVAESSSREQARKQMAIFRLRAAGIKNARQVVTLLEVGGFLREEEIIYTDNIEDNTLIEYIKYSSLFDKETIKCLQELENPVVALERLNILAPWSQRIWNFRSKNTISALNLISEVDQDIFEERVSEIDRFTFIKPFRGGLGSLEEHFSDESNISQLAKVFSRDTFLSEEEKEKFELAQRLHNVASITLPIETVMKRDADELHLLLSLGRHRYRIRQENISTYFDSFKLLKEKGLLEKVVLYLNEGVSLKDSDVEDIFYFAKREEEQDEIQKHVESMTEFLEDSEKKKWLMTLLNNRPEKGFLIHEGDVKLARATFDERDLILISAMIATSAENPVDIGLKKDLVYGLARKIWWENKDLFKDFKDFKPDPVFFEFFKRMEKIDPQTFDFSKISFLYDVGDEQAKELLSKLAEVAELYQPIQDSSIEEKIEVLEQMELLAGKVFGEAGEIDHRTRRLYSQKLLSYILEDSEASKEVMSFLPGSIGDYRALKEREDELKEKLKLHVSPVDGLTNENFTVGDAVNLTGNFNYLLENSEEVRKKIEGLGLLSDTTIHGDLDEFVWFDGLSQEQLSEIKSLIDEGKFNSYYSALKNIRHYLENREVIDETAERLVRFFGQQAEVIDDYPVIPARDPEAGKEYPVTGETELFEHYFLLSRLSKVKNLDATLDVAINLWEYGYKPSMKDLLGLSKVLGDGKTSAQFLDVCRKFQEISGDEQFFESFKRIELEPVTVIVGMSDKEKEDFFKDVESLKSLDTDISPSEFASILFTHQMKDLSSVLILASSLHNKDKKFSLKYVDKIEKIQEEDLEEEARSISRKIKKFYPGADIELLTLLTLEENRDGLVEDFKVLTEDCGLKIPDGAVDVQGIVDFLITINFFEDKEKYFEFLKVGKNFGFITRTGSSPLDFEDFINDSKNKQKQVFSFMSKFFHGQGISGESMNYQSNEYKNASEILSVVINEKEDSVEDRSDELLQRIGREEYDGVIVSLVGLPSYAREILMQNNQEGFEGFLDLLRKMGYPLSNTFLQNLVNTYKGEEWPAAKNFLEFYRDKIERDPESDIKTEEIKLTDYDIEIYARLIKSGITNDQLVDISESARRRDIEIDIFKDIAEGEIFKEKESLVKALREYSDEIVVVASEHPNAFSKLFSLFARNYLETGKGEDEVQAFGEALKFFSDNQVDSRVWEANQGFLPMLIDNAGINSPRILETASRKEGIQVLKLLNDFSRKEKISLNSEEDFKTFQAFINEVGVFDSPIIFSMFKYIHQGGKGEFPEELEEIGIKKDSENIKQIFTQEIQRMRRSIVQTGQLKNPESAIEREILMVEGRFNAGRFKRSGSAADINSVVEQYYRDQAAKLIEPLPERYTIKKFDMDLLIDIEISPAAQRQAEGLMDQASSALELHSRPMPEVVENFNDQVKVNVEDKMKNMQDTVTEEQEKFEERKKAKDFNQKKEEKRLEMVSKNIRSKIEAYNELLERLEQFHEYLKRVEDNEGDTLDNLQQMHELTLFGKQEEEEPTGKLDLRNQLLQMYLKTLLNFEQMYFKKKGSPQLTSVISLAAMLHAFENDHNIGISHELREEITDLVGIGEVNMSVVNSLAEFVNITIKEHSLEITNLSSDQKKRVIRNLNINSLRENIENHSRAKAEGTKTITCIPTRGVLAELSGDLGDACWVRTANIMRDNPEIVADIFAENMDEPLKTRSIGSCLLIENTVGGYPAIILRGANPRQELFDQGGSPTSFLRGYIDERVSEVAQYLGSEKKAEYVYIVAPKPRTGAFSNRPPLKIDATFNEFSTGEEVILETPNNFNYYDITNNCVVLKKVKIK